LLSYFGEPIPPCGHCGICLGDAPAQLAARNAAPIDPSFGVQIDQLAQHYPQALGQPRQKARFLCGLNSPAITGQRSLRANPLFASYAHIPFKTIFAALSQ